MYLHCFTLSVPTLVYLVALQVFLSPSHDFCHIATKPDPGLKFIHANINNGNVDDEGIAV